MYAIIRVGGHQEKVTVGERITVDHIKQDAGSEVRFIPLMVSGDDGTVASDHKELQETAAVLGTIVDHVRGDKIDVFQYRQKTGYRRHIGARQVMTLVEISQIRLGDRVSTIEEVRAAEEEAKAAKVDEQKAAAEAKAAAKTAKATAKKVAAKAGKPARKPPAAKASGAKKAAAKPKPAAKQEKEENAPEA
jgi:large subunit ribosomal protein L21